MSFIPFNSLPVWVEVSSLGAHVAAGALLGGFYFHGLWWNASLFTSGNRVMLSIVVMIGRFVVLGGLLTLASLEGALPLLAMAGGVLIARFATIRRLRAAS